MDKNKIIKVQDINIRIKNINNNDFICLTDIAKSKNSEEPIRMWIKNRNTIEYLGIWESLNNENFKPVEFDGFKKEAGLNSFSMSPDKWVKKTGAIGIIAISGKYGGTYAHKDIAFHFAMWISPIFQLYIIKEYQKLKELENNQFEWDVKRILSKANYHIHTDAIKDYIIPKNTFKKESIVYADEADLLNLALFGCTAKEFRDSNPDVIKYVKNIRDFASINELLILANLESLNAHLIKEGIDKNKRFEILKDTAKKEKEILDAKDYSKSIKKLNNQKEKLSSFDEKLKTALNYNPQKKLK